MCVIAKAPFHRFLYPTAKMWSLRFKR